MRDIVTTVLDHAEKTPERLCARTFSRRVKEEARSLAEVAGAAGRAAAFYEEQGLRRGDVVILVGTHHIDFYAAWLGCVWLGAIPSVLAEPSVRVAKEIYWSRLDQLIARIEAWGLVFDPRIKMERGLLKVAHAHAYNEVAAGTGPVPPRVNSRPDELLLLQHSSGTTGLQKGVMLSHRAVYNHEESYRRELGTNQNDIIASWLPLYHDMGFVACFLSSLLNGAPVVWLSPFEWVANPALLLEAVTTHRATLAWLPNFAFVFLAQRTKAAPGHYDLSSLRALINCSEPVNADSMQAFADRFAGDRFSPQALQTCYAMAENVFAVSTSSDRCPPRHVHLDRAVWQTEHRCQPVAADVSGAIVHVSNGKCVPNCDVKIVDEHGHPLPCNHAGQILIRSPFLFDGYFRRDDLNSALFNAEGFYDTGDLGYVDADGHVYVTGRAKDLIIVGGKNVYPQDVEQVVGQVLGVHSGRVVCFGVSMRGMGTEGLVVLAESDEPETSWPDVEQRVRMTGPSRLDVDLADARVVPRGSLRKSTSGKLARAGNREWYLAGKFGNLPEAISSEA